MSTVAHVSGSARCQMGTSRLGVSHSKGWSRHSFNALQYLHSLTRQNPPDLATDLNGVELPHLGLMVWRAGHMSCGSCEIGAGKPMYYQIHVSDFLLLTNRYEIWEPCFFWELRKACFLDDSKGLHHIFVIGDWGGVAGSWGEERTVMQILLDIVGRY